MPLPRVYIGYNDYLSQLIDHGTLPWEGVFKGVAWPHPAKIKIYVTYVKKIYVSILLAYMYKA